MLKGTNEQSFSRLRMYCHNLEMALRTIHFDMFKCIDEDLFSRLYMYCLNIELANLGIVTNINTGNEDWFHLFFIAFGHMVRYNLINIMFYYFDY